MSFSKIILLFLISINIIKIEKNIEFPIEKNIHSKWDFQLKKYVSENGVVNYKKWLNQIEDLKSYIQILRKYIPNENWTNKELLSYWINAYNALIVLLILENYPITSIKDIPDRWDKKIFEVGSISYSLSNIEHDILRKLNDPRIHFAINCASKSCPKLLNKAYQINKLNEQLDSSSRSFILDSTKNIITYNKLKLSKIFLWYSSDFGQKKDKLEFIKKHSNTDISSSPKINYMPYNWSLNE